MYIALHYVTLCYIAYVVLLHVFYFRCAVDHLFHPVNVHALPPTLFLNVPPLHPLVPPTLSLRMEQVNYDLPASHIQGPPLPLPHITATPQPRVALIPANVDDPLPSPSSPLPLPPPNYPFPFPRPLPLPLFTPHLLQCIWSNNHMRKNRVRRVYNRVDLQDYTVCNSFTELVYKNVQ